MKKYHFFILAVLGLQTLSLTAQTYEKRTIKAGENWFDYAYYLFPSFTDGTARIKDGGQLKSKMNFNMLLCQMQFINAHGDTLNIANPSEIDSIRLNNKSFFYKNGYFEILDEYGSVKLMVSRSVKYEPVKIGAMGIPSHGTSIDSYATLRDQNDTKLLILNEDLDVVLESSYFLTKNNGDLVVASKSNFLNLFEKNKQSIEGYLKLNKPNFNKQSDLQKLFDFCNN